MKLFVCCLMSLFFCCYCSEADQSAVDDYDHELLLKRDALINLQKRFMRAEVDRIIAKLKVLSKRSKSLDSLGRNSMAESSEMLACGPGSVEFLSVYMKRTDINWKVKYWIADMLGYIKCEESKRVLRKVKNDFNYNDRVRLKALESLRILLNG